MKGKAQRRYSAEFKEQAVELLQAGRPVAELGEELGISANLLYAWRQARQRPQIGSATQRTSCGRCLECVVTR